MAAMRDDTAPHLRHNAPMQPFARQPLTARLRDLPVLAQREDELPAAIYNLWRRLRLREGPHVELALPGLKEMRLVLEDAAWAVVDSNRHDVPVLAWVEFSALRSRSALHEPIRCKVNYYHHMASGVRARALQQMEEMLTRRLSRRR